MDATQLSRLRVMDRLGAEIGRAVTALYTDVATNPAKQFHFPTGRAAALLAGYHEADLHVVPDDVVDRFAGVGCPLRHVAPAAGQRVLDLGCGAGTDVFLAAQRVGPEGTVVGVDLTQSMVRTCQAALAQAGIGHARVVQARAPRLDVQGPFDLATSNGVLNLIPEKAGVLDRLHGLLGPGGRLVLADIVLGRRPSAACLADAELWAECLVGAYTETQYLEALEAAGFVEIQVHQRRDYFQHSASRKTRATAADLGAFAWVVSARKD